jgi:hypothetical protein
MVDGRSGQHDTTIKTRRWRPLVPARATPSPGERARPNFATQIRQGLNQGVDVIVVQRAGSAHSVPTPSSYVVTRRNLDRKKPVSFLCRMT